MKKTIFAFLLLFLFPMSVQAESSNAELTHESSLTITEQTSSSASFVENSTVATTDSDDSAATSETENSELSNLQKAQDTTIDQIEKETGIKKSNDPIDNEQDPEKIRTLLKDPSMASILSPSEVDSYSDQQLLNAMLLCQRISADTYGLDVSGYARILQALYKDHTLSWDNIQNIINYDPHYYTNALEMVDKIDSLQAYLAALYPSNSSFMAIRQMSNQELTNVLKHISPLQEEMIATQGNFFPGIIAWIARYANDDDVRSGGTVPTNPSTTETTSTSTSRSSTTASTTAESAENSVPAKSDPNKQEDKILGILPRTGEERRTWLTVAGVLLLVLIAFIMIRRNRKK